MAALPDLGLRCLQEGERLPGSTGITTSPLWDGSSLKHFISSSRSVVSSSAADSLPDCSGEVTLTSTLNSEEAWWWGLLPLPDCSASDREEGQESGGAGLWGSGCTAVVLVEVAVEDGGFWSGFPSSAWPSPDASFCFCSCSFCRLRCFFRNLARRFLNHTCRGRDRVMICYGRGDSHNTSFVCTVLLVCFGVAN